MTMSDNKTTTSDSPPIRYMTRSEIETAWKTDANPTIGNRSTKKELLAEIERLRKLARNACQWMGHYNSWNSSDYGKTWEKWPVGKLWDAVKETNDAR